MVMGYTYVTSTYKAIYPKSRVLNNATKTLLVNIYNLFIKFWTKFSDTVNIPHTHKVTYTQMNMYEDMNCLHSETLTNCF